MLSLYRAWLPPLCLAYPAPPGAAGAVPRPAPPPGAHRPIPRRATASAAAPRAPASPASSASTELDVVELRDSPEPERRRRGAAAASAVAAAASQPQSGAVLDIACCDGPVRFTRVLNESWSGGERPGVGGDGGGGGVGAGGGCGRCSRAAYKSPPAAAACYRKHAAAAARHTHAPDTVQYYPCKTCGSKFPSYYFVHKHRKQCHPDDEPPPPPPHTAATSAPAAPAAPAAAATVTA